MQRVTSRLLLVGVLMMLGAPAQAVVILDIDPGSTTVPCAFRVCNPGSTFGWAFDVTSPLTVNGLAVWDADSDGIGIATMTGLWADGGALLASATITDTSSTHMSTGDGRWLFQSIAPLSLIPGRYVLGSVFNSVAPLLEDTGAFSTIPGVDYVEPRNATLGAGFMRPDSSVFINGLFGPNLVVNSVPEPGSTGLLLLGVFGVFGVARRRFQRSP